MVRAERGTQPRAKATLPPSRDEASPPSRQPRAPSDAGSVPRPGFRTTPTPPMFAPRCLTPPDAPAGGRKNRCVSDRPMHPSLRQSVSEPKNCERAMRHERDASRHPESRAGLTRVADVAGGHDDRTSSRAGPDHGAPLPLEGRNPGGAHLGALRTAPGVTASGQAQRTERCRPSSYTACSILPRRNTSSVAMDDVRGETKPA